MSINTNNLDKTRTLTKQMGVKTNEYRVYAEIVTESTTRNYIVKI